MILSLFIDPVCDTCSPWLKEIHKFENYIYILKGRHTAPRSPICQFPHGWVDIGKLKFWKVSKSPKHVRILVRPSSFFGYTCSLWLKEIHKCFECFGILDVCSSVATKPDFWIRVSFNRYRQIDISESPESPKIFGFWHSCLWSSVTPAASDL